MEVPYIGKMDRKIVVKTTTKVRNDVGEQRTAEQIVLQPFAYKKELSGGEDTEGKVRSLFTRSYTIRYNAQIKQLNNNLIVEDGSDKMSVEYVKEIGRKTHLELICKYYE